MMTGYEQVRSLVAKIAGDDAAAARGELVLPETGVCSAADFYKVACCGPSQPAVPCCGAGEGRNSGDGSGTFTHDRHARA
jgi:hypothetical protein